MSSVIASEATEIVSSSSSRRFSASAWYFAGISFSKNLRLVGSVSSRVTNFIRTRLMSPSKAESCPAGSVTTAGVARSFSLIWETQAQKSAPMRSSLLT